MSPADTTETERLWSKDARIYEYGSAANPDMAPIPVLVHPPQLHESGETRVIPFDISAHMDISTKATSPNLMASFVRIVEGESISTNANATSQAFYVIRGSGYTESEEHGTISWNTGDLFVVPVTNGEMKHFCESADMGGAALYWIHDEPLMEYLGVTPSKKKFEATLYKHTEMMEHVEEIRHSDTKSTNRLGVLLGNAKCAQTKTLTHVLWSLLNSIPPHSVQRPHRHNSVALDLCVATSPNVYTLMGREIDEHGFIVDPIRCDWAPGGVFVTPPGWWHSHHNESEDTAWVLPIQDAGLFTHQRTLDIRFVDDELALHYSGRIRGSAFTVTDDQMMKMKQLSRGSEGETEESTNEQATCNAEVVTSQDGETRDDDVPMVPNRERAGSIQVGSLAREKSTTSVERPSTVTLHKRRKSIQVGADLKLLRRLSSSSAIESTFWLGGGKE